MANYTMFDLLNLVEVEDVTPAPAIRQKRRDFARRAKIRGRENDIARKFKRAKQEHDNEIWFVPVAENVDYPIHDSKLWKPLDKRGRR